MTRDQQSEVRRIVARGGWQAVRDEHPDLWRIIVAERREDARYVDRYIDVD